MAKTYRLIDQAVRFYTRGHFADAMSIIKDALSNDPGNLAVWDTYISFLSNEYDCEQARQRLMGITTWNSPDEFGMMMNQQYLLRRIDSKAEELRR